MYSNLAEVEVSLLDVLGIVGVVGCLLVIGFRFVIEDIIREWWADRKQRNAELINLRPDRLADGKLWILGRKVDSERLKRGRKYQNERQYEQHQSRGADISFDQPFDAHDFAEVEPKTGTKNTRRTSAVPKPMLLE